MDNDIFKIAAALHQEIETVYRQLSYLDACHCFTYQLIETIPDRLSKEAAVAKLYGDSQVQVSENTNNKIRKLIKDDLNKKLKKLEKDFEELE